MRASTDEILDWLEEASSFTRLSREMCFAEGQPVFDRHGQRFDSEEDYLGIPEWARTEGGHSCPPTTDDSMS